MRLIARLRQRARELKTEVVALWLAARHPRTPWYAKAFLVAIVAYALSPIDLIPDFIPVLGFVDEIILLPFAIVLAVKMVPAEVMTECRGRAARESPASWMGRLGAVFVVLLWLALAALAAIWAHRAFAAPGAEAALSCSAWCADAQCAPAGSPWPSSSWSWCLRGSSRRSWCRAFRRTRWHRHGERLEPGDLARGISVAILTLSSGSTPPSEVSLRREGPAVRNVTTQKGRAL